MDRLAFVVAVFGPKEGADHLEARIALVLGVAEPIGGAAAVGLVVGQAVLVERPALGFEGASQIGERVLLGVVVHGFPQLYLLREVTARELRVGSCGLGSGSQAGLSRSMVWLLYALQAAT